MLAATGLQNIKDVLSPGGIISLFAVELRPFRERSCLCRSLHSKRLLMWRTALRLITKENTSLNCEVTEKVFAGCREQRGRLRPRAVCPVWLEIWISESLLTFKNTNAVKSTRQEDVCLSAHWMKDVCWHCPTCASLLIGLKTRACIAACLIGHGPTCLS